MLIGRRLTHRRLKRAIRYLWEDYLRFLSLTCSLRWHCLKLFTFGFWCWTKSVYQVNYSNGVAKRFHQATTHTEFCCFILLFHVIVIVKSSLYQIDEDDKKNRRTFLAQFFSPIFLKVVLLHLLFLPLTWILSWKMKAFWRRNDSLYSVCNSYRHFQSHFLVNGVTKVK